MKISIPAGKCSWVSASPSNRSAKTETTFRGRDESPARFVCYRALESGALEFGVSLELGAWDLELPRFARLFRRLYGNQVNRISLTVRPLKLQMKSLPNFFLHM